MHWWKNTILVEILTNIRLLSVQNIRSISWDQWKEFNKTFQFLGNMVLMSVIKLQQESLSCPENQKSWNSFRSQSCKSNFAQEEGVAYKRVSEHFFVYFWRAGFYGVSYIYVLRAIERNSSLRDDDKFNKFQCWWQSLR